MAAYHSQVAQDWLLDRFVFRGKRNGFFVDVGAYDGVTASNTLMFERDRCWSGICIEPNPVVFPRLRESRSATCLNLGASDREDQLPFVIVQGEAEMLSGFRHTMDPRHVERIERENAKRGGSMSTIQVPARPLNDILAEMAVGDVDYLSIDTEGSEPDILASCRDPGRIIHVISAEGNYRSAQEALTRAVGDLYLPPVLHRHDLFFVHRNSPYRRNLPALRAAVIGLHASRWVQRKAASVRKRLPAPSKGPS